MTTTHLYLVRHGETLWNAEQRMQGHLNSDLTDQGKEQARLLGVKLADWPIDTCYTSDSQRALETAELVTKQLPVTPQTDPRLREISMGTWEGQTRQAIQQTDSQEWHNFWHAPELFSGLNGGETFAVLEERVNDSLTDILLNNEGKHILIVSHRLTIKMMINTLQKNELADLHQLADIDPNSLSTLNLINSTVKISQYSDTSHYK